MFVLRLWLWASDHKQDGDLCGLTGEHIEIACRWEGDPGKLVAAMREVGFLDGEDGELVIHQWAEHQPWVAGRQRRVDAATTAATARWERERNAAGKRPASEADAQRINKDAEGMRPACDPHAPGINPQCGSSETAMPPTQPNPTQPNERSKAIAPSAPAKRSTQLPAGFDMTDEMRQFALGQGVADPAKEFAAFVDYHRSKGSTFKDWHAAWRTWARNAMKFSHSKGKAPPAGYLSENTEQILRRLNEQSGETTQ